MSTRNRRALASMGESLRCESSLPRGLDGVEAAPARQGVAARAAIVALCSQITGELTGGGAGHAPHTTPSKITGAINPRSVGPASPRPAQGRSVVRQNRPGAAKLPARPRTRRGAPLAEKAGHPPFSLPKMA